MSKLFGKIPISFYLTTPHACPYLDKETAQTLLLSPEIDVDANLYSKLIQQGFRRSGEHIYRPHCESCHGCQSCRVLVQQFVPKRRFKRTMKRAQALTLRECKARFSMEHFQLYDKYVAARHQDGDMYPTSVRQYQEFLLCPWMECYFLEMRNAQGKLIGCCVFDRLDDGLSALYSFFDPDFANFSPGQLAVLTLIEIARAEDLPYVYLGYWIKDCAKMSYKQDYSPLQVFSGGHWKLLE